MEGDLREDVRAGHSDEEWLLVTVPQSLIGSKGANNHLSDGVEDSSLPVCVVGLHGLALARLVGIRRVLDRALLDTLEVVVTNELVVLHQVGNHGLSVRLEKLGELRDVHRLHSFEIDLLDDLSILDLVHLLIDVFGVGHAVGLRLFEGVDGSLALPNVLVNRQGEPIVVVDTLVHELVKLFDVVAEESSFNRSQVTDSLLVTAKQLVQLIDVAHVLLLLEGNIDDCLGDLLANAAEELGLANCYLELRRKVDSVHIVLVVLFAVLDFQDVFLEQIDCLVGVRVPPGVEYILFIVLVKVLVQGYVLLGYILEVVAIELISLGLELLDRCHNSSNDCAAQLRDRSAVDSDHGQIRLHRGSLDEQEGSNLQAVRQGRNDEDAEAD